MSEAWQTLIQAWLPVLLLSPLVISALCSLLVYLVLLQTQRLKERALYLEAAFHRDMTLVLLEPLTSRCETLRRGLTALGMRHGNPYSPERRTIEEECDAFLATQRDLRGQVHAASQGLEQLRRKELKQRCSTFATLRERTNELIIAIQKRETFRDTELLALKARTNP